MRRLPLRTPPTTKTVALAHLVALTLAVSWTNAALISPGTFGHALPVALVALVLATAAPMMAVRLGRAARTEDDLKALRLQEALWPIGLAFSVFAIVYVLVIGRG